MAIIQVLIENKVFYTESRGSKMTLKFEPDSYNNDIKWVMLTTNASNRAYNRGIPMPKYFASLEAVEAHYKTWKGVSKLVDESALMANEVVLPPAIN